MRINETTKISEIFNNSAVLNDENKRYAEQMNESLNNLKKYSEINSAFDSLSFAANKLRTSAESFNSLTTDYDNPVTGKTEQSNQTVDALQADRLKNQISKFTETYNKALENADVSQIKNAAAELEKIAPDKNLENIGVTKNKDGSIKFDESKFDETVKADETKVADVKTYMSSLEKLTAETTAAAAEGKSDLNELFNSAKNSITELQSNFTTEQNDYFKNSLNALFNANSLQTLLAGLGIGRNLNDIV